MTPAAFTARVQDFFDACMAIMRPKNQDYNPRQAVMYDVFVTACREGIQPETVLRVLLRKHWTVIEGWTLGQRPASESINSRLHDAANHLAIMSVLADPPSRDEVFAGIFRVEKASCACGCVSQIRYNEPFRSIDFGHPPQRCEHGGLCLWLVRLLISLDSNPESWPTTLRELGWSPTDHSPTGATFPRDPSRSPTATTGATPATTDMKSTTEPDVH